MKVYFYSPFTINDLEKSETIGGTTQDTDSYAKKADNYIMGNRHAKLNDDAFESVNIAAYYTSRPTNVSVLFCIKY